MRYLLARTSLLLTATLVTALPAVSMALERMKDSEMSSVRAREGISIGLEIRLNTNASGSPLNSVLTNCGGPSGSGPYTNSECRFGLLAEGRENGDGGRTVDEWVVFRGVYGSLLINDIRLDAGILSDPAAPDAYFDAARFQDPSGACLLPGGTCSNTNLEDDPALVFEYPATTTGYDPGTGTSSGYTSLEIGYTIKETRLIFENNGFDNTSTGGSFLGVEVADNNANRAGIAISGQAYVYGF